MDEQPGVRLCNRKDVLLHFRKTVKTPHRIQPSRAVVCAMDSVIYVVVPGMSRRKSVFRLRQRVGKYRLERRAERTPLWEKFHATDTVMGVPVVLRIPERQLVTRAFLDQFREDSAQIAGVEHPGILQLRDASLVDGRLLISSTPGLESLQERLTRRVSVETAVRLCDQLLDTMVSVHRQRVVHGNLHSDNLILFADGTLRVAGFALSRALTQSARRCRGFTPRLDPVEVGLAPDSIRWDTHCAARICYRLLVGRELEEACEGTISLNAARRIPVSTLRWLERATSAQQRGTYHDAGALQRSWQRVRGETLRLAGAGGKRPRTRPRTRPRLRLRAA